MKLVSIMKASCAYDLDLFGQMFEGRKEGHRGGGRVVHASGGMT